MLDASGDARNGDFLRIPTNTYRNYQEKRDRTFDDATHCRTFANSTYQNLGEVGGGVAIGVGSLDNADLDTVDAGGLDEVHDKHGRKTGDLVTVKEAEGALLIPERLENASTLTSIDVVVDQPISIAVKRGGAVTAGYGRAGGETLPGLDVVGAAL
ncbi:hypothetical protein BC938DRAFT_475418 [Jimgerdemannia flammicorona]|uniref:Uncharacterized protein n=1 Tax=Jimgerdemannia flammicorona TaxID=994334 RepID=A0A433QZB9_9FUNG|nr:hypothetical protein BC938DRAFT_475418 [Jimgerdemannia flammicorona]